jgi:tRNA C32,U32 (ribose-2'-O)-methylase TrmJ
MELRELIAAQRESISGLTPDQQKALVLREFQHFINKARICDQAQLKALLKQMRAAAAKAGFSEHEIAAIYHADALLALRRLALLQ